MNPRFGVFGSAASLGGAAATRTGSAGISRRGSPTSWAGLSTGSAERWTISYWLVGGGETGGAALISLVAGPALGTAANRGGSIAGFGVTVLVTACATVLVAAGRGGCETSLSNWWRTFLTISASSGVGFKPT